MEFFWKSVMSKSVCLYYFHAECVTGDLAAELREVGVAVQLLCIAPDVVETPLGRKCGEEARQIECSSTSLSWSCRLQVRRRDCGDFCAFSNLKSHCQTKFALAMRPAFLILALYDKSHWEITWKRFPVTVMALPSTTLAWASSLIFQW
jgi:hypothetical protein